MIDRRGAIRLALASPPALLLLCLAARAEPAFQRFTPFLIDLPGWKGNKPDGMAMETAGLNMITATRQYQRDKARVEASIITGPAAQGALAATGTRMNIETSDGRVSTLTIDGLQVTSTYAISQKSGAILVALGPAALFGLTFHGVADDEGLALAKKFNWKAIQAAVPK